MHSHGMRRGKRQEPSHGDANMTSVEVSYHDCSASQVKGMERGVKMGPLVRHLLNARLE